MSTTSRLKLAGAVLVAFACGLVFASGFDLTKLGFAQGNTPVRSASLTPAPASVVELNTSFVGIAERVTPGVVSIAAVRTVEPNVQRRQGQQRENVPPGLEDFFQQFGDPRQQRQPSASSGSGFIVSEDGYILTNNHVVENFDRIRVKLNDNREYTAKLVGRDPQTDVAVLKIDGKNLPITVMGDDNQAKVGEWVLAIGNPLGLEHTVTAGIISAKGRGGNVLPDLSRDRYSITDHIQTDAAINPGNSGGPLVNIRGEVIGINSAIATRTGYYQGYGFAIPITLARDVMNDLIKNGRVRRAVIGVSIRDLTPEDAEAAGLKEIKGVLVAGYSSDDSPARRAGLEEGDVIVAADGKDADRVSTLQRIIRSHAPGETVNLDVMRFGSKKSFKVKLAEQPADEQLVAAADEQPEEPAIRRNSDSMKDSKLGVTVEAVTDAFARDSKLPTDQRGVVVKDIEPNTPAAGNFRGNGTEVITAVLYPRPRRDIRTTEDLAAAIKQVGTSGALQLLVYDIQQQQTRVVSLRLGDNR
jgi:serine protease Do